MVKIRFLCALLLGLNVGSFAQMRNMAVDDSSVLNNVHRVAVFINLGPTIPAPYQPNYDRAKKQVSEKLAKYKLELAPDASSADLVLVVREYNLDSGAVAAGGVARDLICLADEVKVYKGGSNPGESDSPIWLASDSCGFSWPLNRVMDKFGKSINR